MAVTTVAMVLFPAGAALAEGQWSSSMTAVRTGFDSRTWTDKNGDGTSTSIYLAGCRDSYTRQNLNTNVQLTKENTWTPDQNLGVKYFPCGDASRLGAITSR